MKKLSFVFCLAVALVLYGAFYSAFCQEQKEKLAAKIEVSDAGWIYPVGKSAYGRNGCGSWLGRDSDNGGCYFSGYYHTGKDMIVVQNRKVLVPILALADGEVSFIDWKGKSWSSKGLTPNIAVFIKHPRLDGGYITGLYGHIDKATVVVSDQGEKRFVKAGDVIGYVGEWAHSDHLHFAWVDGARMPGADITKGIGWGMMSNSHFGDKNPTNSFCDPAKLFGSESKIFPKNTQAVTGITTKPRVSINPNLRVTQTQALVNEGLLALNQQFLQEASKYGEFPSFVTVTMPFQTNLSKALPKFQPWTREKFYVSYTGERNQDVKKAFFDYCEQQGMLIFTNEHPQMRTTVTEKAQKFLSLSGWKPYKSTSMFWTRKIHYKLELISAETPHPASEFVEIAVKCRWSFETPFEGFADYFYAHSGHASSRVVRLGLLYKNINGRLVFYGLMGD